MVASILTTKGQTTIPLKIRSYLGLHSGDKIEFLIDKEGKVIIMPLSLDASILKGSLPKPAKKVSVEDMRRVIAKRGAGLCKG